MKVGVAYVSALISILAHSLSVEAGESAMASAFKKISGQGFNEFVLVSPTASSADYAAAIASVCEDRDVCFVRFWDAPKLAADKLPMTSAQIGAMVAHYARNRRSGVDHYVCHPFGGSESLCR